MTKHPPVHTEPSWVTKRREPNFFKKGQRIYCFGDAQKIPAHLSHLVNRYNPGTIRNITDLFNFGGEMAPQLVIQIDEEDVIIYHALSVKIRTEDELFTRKPFDTTDHTAIQRLLDFNQPPEQLPDDCYPPIHYNDPCVVFLPPNPTGHTLPDRVNTFMTGQTFQLGYTGDLLYPIVKTHEPCARAGEDPDGAYTYDYPPSSENQALIIYRGDYEKLRLHPEWIEQYLDASNFVFPLVYADHATEKSQYIELLKASFDYIPRVIFPT